MGQRNRCQRSSPGKQSGWVLLNLGNGGMEYVRTYFSWRKERQMSFDRDLALGNKKGVIDLGNKTRTNRCRDPITQGLFYDNLLRKPLWSSP